MKLLKKTVLTFAILFAGLCFATVAAPAITSYAAEETAETEEAKDDSTGAKAIAAAIAIGLAGGLGTIAMGMSVGKTAEGIARQPEAAGNIRTTMILGVVFIETAVLYALVVAILIIFVL
ncbi:ATP synthase F0 subcomplex C subunit [Lachnospiraceae bacterium]|nr:ATP synthase F0 subcomplex C subunit [Lachnospiraceae bacterium]